MSLPTEHDLAKMMEKLEAATKVAEKVVEQAPSSNGHISIDSGLTKIEIETPDGMRPIACDVYQCAKDMNNVYHDGLTRCVVPFGGMTIKEVKYNSGDEVTREVMDEMTETQLEKLGYRDTYWFLDQVIAYVDLHYKVRVSYAQADRLYHLVNEEVAKKKQQYLKSLRDKQMLLRSTA